MMPNALIEKICDDCDAGRLSSLPLQKLEEYKEVLEKHGNPYPSLSRWTTRVPDTLDVLDKIISEKQIQESRDSEHLSLNRSALSTSRWALFVSILAITISVIPIIVKISWKLINE